MRRFLSLAGSCFLAAGLANAACACTGIYVGKGVTTDGSVLIGRTVDFPPYNATMRQQICERGAQVSFGGHTNRYRYVCAPKSTSMHAGLSGRPRTSVGMFPLRWMR